MMTRVRCWLPFMLGLGVGAVLWLALAVRTVYRRIQVCCPAYPALAPLEPAAGLGLWRRRRLRHSS